LISIVPQMKIFLAYASVDFRKGIDGLVAVCRQQLLQDPVRGALFLFRNRRGTAIKLLCYDGQGYWMMMKRFSTGRIQWWPKSMGEPLTQLAAKQLQIILYNGNPDAAQLAEDWRQLPHYQ